MPQHVSAIRIFLQPRLLIKRTPLFWMLVQLYFYDPIILRLNGSIILIAITSEYLFLGQLTTKHQYVICVFVILNWYQLTFASTPITVLNAIWNFSRSEFLSSQLLYFEMQLQFYFYDLMILWGWGPMIYRHDSNDSMIPLI